ncbi:hypothetical protein H0Z60_11620 [Ectothiorhodospiraceae bacterium WFHF3C12]|nr:hypothetical protein [Ectothiorhodospiraceae bacterium WFHF3C12]
MSRSIVLHIGLHKTATRFFQKSVFRHLDDADVEYNPESLFSLLDRTLRHPQDEEARRAFIEEARRRRDADDSRPLLISLPEISGNMFNNHLDYQENLALMKSIFPRATILYFVRRQADWLLSAYKQSLRKGKSGPIEVFLNWYDGGFQPRPSRRVHGMRTLDPLDLRFWDIYEAYAESYGPENVYMFRYEDFRRRRGEVLGHIERILGVRPLPVHQPKGVRNRQYSALAITLFWPRLPGRYRRPRPTPDLGPPTFWRLYSPRRLLTNVRRQFVQKVFDRIIYRDWDLLQRHGMREIIDEYYADEYRRIETVATEILDHGPSRAAFEAAYREQSHG